MQRKIGLCSRKLQRIRKMYINLFKAGGGAKKVDNISKTRGVFSNFNVINILSKRKNMNCRGHPINKHKNILVNK